MSTYRPWTQIASRAGIIAVSALFGVLAPLAAQAKPSSGCYALVPAADALQLVTPNGKVLANFPTGGASADFATLSPKADKVAYASGESAKTIEVVNQFGQQGSFPLNASNDTDELAYEKVMGYLMELAWNSDNVLRVTRFGGKDFPLFEFRRIPEDLSPPAPLIKKASTSDNCVLKGDGEQLACIARDGAVYLGGGGSSGQSIFVVSAFDGVKPQESFTLGVGQSATTTTTELAYKLTLKKIDKNGITIRITTPSGYWEQSLLSSGNYDFGAPAPYEYEYDFSVTLINKKPAQVRVDVTKSKSNFPKNPFDLGLTWQPHGEGLLFIQQTKTQTFLDLIQPGRGRVNGHPAKGQGAQWHLAAQVPISAPSAVQSMRFLTPTLLLMDTGSPEGPSYSEATIHIANGQENGKPSLTVGTVKSLPAKIAVTTNGKTIQASVLDWSCKAPHGDGDSGGD